MIHALMGGQRQGEFCTGLVWREGEGGKEGRGEGGGGRGEGGGTEMAGCERYMWRVGEVLF